LIISTPIQTDPESKQSPVKSVPESFLGVKWTWIRNDYLHPPGAEIKTKQSYRSTPPFVPESNVAGIPLDLPKDIL
jgi:hypothetical protein